MPNETVHSGCTDPTQATAHLVTVLVNRIQKSHTGDNNFVKMERGISVQPTKMTRLVKVGHIQRWSRVFQSDQIYCNNIMIIIDVPTEISGILG